MKPLRGYSRRSARIVSSFRQFVAMRFDEGLLVRGDVFFQKIG